MPAVRCGCARSIVRPLSLPPPPRSASQRSLDLTVVASPTSLMQCCLFLAAAPSRHVVHRALPCAAACLAALLHTTPIHAPCWHACTKLTSLHNICLAVQLRFNKVSELIHNSTHHRNLDRACVTVHFQEIVDKVCVCCSVCVCLGVNVCVCHYAYTDAYTCMHCLVDQHRDASSCGRYAPHSAAQRSHAPCITADCRLRKHNHTSYASVCVCT